MRETSQRVIRECLNNLREIKRQKAALKEHYQRSFKNESRRSDSRRAKRYIESQYEQECNDFVNDCQEELAQCCQLPELKCCWNGVCNRQGQVYDDCPEEDFDAAVDNAIETLAWLVVPVRVRC